jgi:2-aminoadipate transaminase
MTSLTEPRSVADRLRGVISSPVREILALTERPGVISFAGGLPAPELFDVEGLRDAYAAVLADGHAGRSLQYSTTEGDPALRDAVAKRLTARGLGTDADELLITSGSQQALTLLATVLLEPGDRVLVEEPSYLAALQCFQLAGAVTVPVHCDEDGLDPDALAELIAVQRPRLLYTIPTFHNPTGRTLPLERRRAIAALAQAAGLWVIEDDPYGELRYHGQPLPAIASLPEAADCTLALSTLSKIAAPGLRLGWVRAPQSLRRPLTIAKQAADLHSSTIDQAAAARWLASVDLDAHVACLRAAYGARRDTLVDGLDAALPPGSSHNHPDGGMFVWARLPDGWDANALLPRALERDVAFVPGAPFFSGPPDPSALRLSFTAHPPEEIRNGLARLAEALSSGPAGGDPPLERSETIG